MKELNLLSGYTRHGNIFCSKLDKYFSNKYAMRDKFPRLGLGYNVNDRLKNTLFKQEIKL